jgi:glyoxylase-like metal-dependent hydrolase (beta-lactamase superfamily II)
VLFDAGEGTLGQLYRRLGPASADALLLRLSVIVISHMHADHHTGIAEILERRAQLARAMAGSGSSAEAGSGSSADAGSCAEAGSGSSAEAGSAAAGSAAVGARPPPPPFVVGPAAAQWMLKEAATLAECPHVFVRAERFIGNRG